jgi:hypothetical protein
MTQTALNNIRTNILTSDNFRRWRKYLDIQIKRAEHAINIKNQQN